VLNIVLFSRERARAQGYRAKSHLPKGQEGKEDVALKEGHYSR
jgi:hypothetical protein